MEAIVLAGGFGTRLRSSVPDLPKCMAPIHGHPFLHYLIQYATKAGIQKIVFALGYKADIIIDYLQLYTSDIVFDYVIEDIPLGTGGAILNAMQKTSEKHPIILNGDTFYDVDLKLLHAHHLQSQAHITIALKPMQNFERYGAVTLDENGIVTEFAEKKPCKSGNINGGIYVIDKAWYTSLELGAQFSFEVDVLSRNVGFDTIYGWIDDGYFIDIGIPEDFERAQTELFQLCSESKQ